MAHRALDRLVPAALSAALAFLSGAGTAAELPVPCVGGACGAAAPTFVTSGQAGLVQSGNSMTVNQTSANATLNWQSFNIGAEGSVTFKQPDAASIALNQIHQNDPSRILGALNANGRVFLINQNGILFGEGARVNVGGLIASSLNMTQSAIENGIAQPIRNREPAFTQFRDADGTPLDSGAIRIERGAEITSAAGQVLVFAPEVTNHGRISTPDGQTILAAGQSVYLMSSSDPNLRGLLVEVDAGGTVTNGDAAANVGVSRPEDLVGQIIAERGNVTLAGLAVNQAGRVSATTSVRFNGSIRLLARDTVDATAGTSSNPVLQATRGGTLTTSAGSRSEVTLDLADESTAVDATAPARSQVLLSGERIHVLEGSRLTATAGSIELNAASDPRFPVSQVDRPDASRIYVAAGARLDVRGASVELPMERNVVEVQLRANEMRDSPEQREGALRGEAVRVDIRRHGTLADGTAWEGTPVADVSGAIDGIARGVAERNLAGGSILIQSQGDALIAPGVTLDVSGGTVTYQSGYVNTSSVISGGRIYDIAEADPSRRYDGIVNAYTTTDPVWGVTRVYPGFPSLGRYEAGYIEGKDAGSVTVLSPRPVLDGTLIGTVTAGTHQRTDTQTLSGNTRLYRPHDQIPLAGQLIVGRANPAGAASSRLTPDVNFTTTRMFPALSGIAGAPFDPLADPWPLELNRLDLSPEVLGKDRMGSLLVYSEGRITVAGGIALNPAGGGGALALVGDAVDFAGAVTSPGASVSFVGGIPGFPADEHAVRLAPTARIDVSGGWANDNPLLGSGAGRGPLLIDGGSVRLEASAGILAVEAGSLIDVSGGIWRRADGRLVAGDAGAITISESARAIDAPAEIRLGGELRAFGYDGGGTLALSAAALCISLSECVDGDALQITPERFAQGGFTSYQLTATRGDLSVSSGTIITPRAQSLGITGDVSRVATGAPLGSIAHVETRSEELRPPVDLTLRVAARAPLGGSAESETDLSEAPRLQIGRDALINLDQGASLSLRSSTLMVVDGILQAPAGRISLELDSALPLLSFAPAQGIWLGSTARLLAPGATRIVTDDAGRRSGEVLDGGTVTVRADRGYFFADAGSVIDVSGATATLDVRPAPDRPQFVTRQFGSAGGLIDILAAEGAQIGGSLLAHGGAGDVPVRGGELRFAIDPTNRAEVSIESGTGQRVSLFPGAPRTVLLTQAVSPTIVQPGTAVPDSLNGIGRIAVQTIEQGGFTDVSLIARNLAEPGGVSLRSAGRLTSFGEVNLQVPGRLVIDAARIDGAGSDLHLAAQSHLSIGSSFRLLQQTGDAPGSGTPRLTLEGGFIDIFGHSAISGFDTAELRSGTDIRGRGLQALGGRTLEGALTSGGDLTLIAAQVYPSTLSDFTFAVDRPDGRLDVRAPGEVQRAPVLSAGGALRLRADTIGNQGALVAPFGTIDLLGDNVTLGAGSLVSVSGAGTTIPFGETQGGFDWVYRLDDFQTLVFGAAEEQLEIPQKHVRIEGSDVRAEAGSVIDAAGGGELLAAEFVPGVGGTLDVLSPAVRPDAFAIVPALPLAYAPFDPSLHAGSGVQPGDTIHIGGGSAVPAGTYTVLPARYATLPGAFLIEPVSGYTDLALGSSVQQLDGTRIVGGFRGIAGTELREGRNEGYVVRSAADVAKLARYDATAASEFFADQAAQLGVAAARLPPDAGVVSFIAAHSLRLQGSLSAPAAMGGRGAALDIASQHIRVTATASSTPLVEGVVSIAAADLTRLGAESLLIGGTRLVSSEGTAISTQADSSVVVEAGADLQAPEILLAASREVTLEEGATIRATPAATAPRGTKRARLTTSGDGALLRVAAGGPVDFERTDSLGAQGDLTIAQGALVSAAGGSVLLDASATPRFDGTLAVAGGDLSLSAQRIAFGGEAPPGTLLLSPGALEALDLRSLELASRSTIGFSGEVTLDVQSLALRADSLTAEADSRVAITAGSARLVGIGAATAAPVPGTAALELRADRLVLEGTILALDGFATTTLDAGADLLFSGLDVAAAGDLQLRGARVTAASGTDSIASALGHLLVASSRQAAVGGPASAEVGLGARLSLRGERVEQAGLIELRSGVLDISATGNASDSVLFAAGSATRLDGIDANFDGVSVGSPGGLLQVNAAAGGLRIAQGASIDVSGAASGGDAGSIALRAPSARIEIDGALRGAATAGFLSGSASVDAGVLPDLAALNRTLNAGGFLNERRFRQRNEGALLLAGSGDAALRAGTVVVVADGGRIDLTGEIDTGDDHKGRVTLAARDGVAVRGSIDASGVADGYVELMSGTGGVDVAPSARIALDDGELRLRVPRAAALTLTDGIAGNDLLRLAGTVSGARRIDLEGFAIYADADGTISAAEVAANASNPRYAEALEFSSHAASIATALGRAGDESFHVLPGVEIRSSGNLTLAADWNLFPWRFDGEAGVLTLRAGGDLLIDRSLSDGFAAITGTGAFLLPTEAQDTWSYRLAAGADVSSALPTAVNALADQAAGTGSFRISPGTVSSNVNTPSGFRMVRTGTGRIEVAAARNFVLGNGTSRASVLYTAGTSSGGVPLTGLGGRAYPDGGGDITIEAGGDYIGAPTNQLVTEWLWRIGRPAGSPSPSATGWTVNFQRFEQGIGALGGGDVRIAIGGNASNLSASLPSIGRQVGGTSPAGSIVEVAGGGDLELRVGGELAGGSLYIGQGSGYVRADSVAPQSTTGFRPLVALGDAQLRLVSRGDAGLEAIVNPTLVRQGSSQAAALSRSFFSTYSEDSGVSISSTAGSVRLGGNLSALESSLSSIPFGGTNEALALRLYPPRLRAVSFAEDVRLASGFTLYPSAPGNLELFAEGNVLLAPVAQQGLDLVVSDADPAIFPSVASPQIGFGVVSDVLLAARQSVNFHARRPVHGDAAAAGLSDPVRLVARTGDVRVEAPFDAPVFFSTPKATRVVAGRDIVDMSLLGQNLVATDVSSLVAGRDVVYTTQRDAFGNIRSSTREIQLAGPGRLEIVAGRNVDLQTARGITTTGNLFNPALAETGASVSVSTGLGSQGPDQAAFITRYLEQGNDYDTLLLAYASALAGRPVGSKAEALAVLRAAPLSQQAALVEQVFFAEIRTSGRAAANSGSQDFTRAFEAIETLYPGSNPDLEEGETNAYAGDLRLYFSRIYTLDGGDITMLTPGGSINAGLATPPAAFGITKTASELGAVVQGQGSVNAFAFGDFLVNESRVFAADGGNILVWSTRGDIDAGRGAKTAISAPAPTITIDDDGRTVVTFPAALTGSGIQTLATSPGRKPGDVDLYAPRGVVNASDAGIVAGNLTVAATAVLGANNITVSGTSVGVPVDTGALSLGVADASAASSGATTAGESVLQGGDRADTEAPLADAALGWLEVFVEGFGEASCKPTDDECLERERQNREQQK